MNTLLPWIGWIVAALIGVALICLGVAKWNYSRDKEAAKEAAERLRKSVRKEAKTEIKKVTRAARATIDAADKDAKNAGIGSLSDYLLGKRRG